jgi:hypothetical protein
MGSLKLIINHNNYNNNNNNNNNNNRIRYNKIYLSKINLIN